MIRSTLARRRPTRCAPDAARKVSYPIVVFGVMFVIATVVLIPEAADAGLPADRGPAATNTAEDQPAGVSQDELSDPMSESPPDYERLPMPVDRELGDGAVSLYAESAHVVIRWDADPYPPYVRAHWSLEDTPGDMLFAMRTDSTSLRYLADPEMAGHPVIELHLSPNQKAAIFGSSLSVEAVEVSFLASSRADDPEAPPPISQLDFEVERSQLTLTNIPILNVNAVETELVASGGIGPWVIEARGGRSELAAHRGSVQYTGHDNEAVLDTVDATVKLDLENTTASIRRGKATVEATTLGGAIDFDQTIGNLTIKGAATLVALRGIRSSRFSLTGDDMYVTAEDGAGAARVTLIGGNLDVTRWETRIDLVARNGATATVRDLDGDIAFDAADGASVGIFGVTGHVRGKARRAGIEVSALKSIELDAMESEVRVADTLNLTAFDLTDSTAFLNLDTLRGERVIALRGTSRADIELHYPCQVRVEGPGAANAGRISVSGCENLRPNQSWASPRVQRHGDQPTESIRLKITMDQRSEVSVTGY